MWRVDRNTGVVTQLVGPSAGLTGIANALDASPFNNGDLYLGIFGNGQIQKLSPPNYTPTLFATMNSTSVSGICAALRPGGNFLFVSMFAGTANASLAGLDVNGNSTIVMGTPQWADLNWVNYDRQRDDLWVVGTAGTRNIWRSDVIGNNMLQHTLPNGLPASIDANDDGDTALVVCPTVVPSPLAPITIEHGLSGTPGYIGVIVMLRPFFLLLAAGPLDAAGNISFKISAIGIPPGNPGRFQFQAATINPANSMFRLSNVANWPAN